MSNRMVVRVKNTFIVIEDAFEARLPRQLSDPTLSRRQVGSGIPAQAGPSSGLQLTSTKKYDELMTEDVFEPDDLHEEDGFDLAGLHDHKQDVPEAHQESSYVEVKDMEHCTFTDRSRSIDVDCAGEWYGKTAVMIRNLSYKCTSDLLWSELRQAGFEHVVDYLYLPRYLPRNRGTSTSKGYAFVNFVDPTWAYECYKVFDSSLMRIPGSKKPLEVVPAKSQGRDANCTETSSSSQQFTENARSSRKHQAPLSLENLVSREQRGALPPATLREALHHPSFSCSSSMIQTSWNDGDEDLRNGRVSPRFCHQCGKSRRREHRFCMWCGVCFAAFPSPSVYF
eukprot:TRINITY_DN13769_c0_g3_i2.p1 TRINITY_DN13769_c0_g3~~TRINITY_DN13769_c0_g3_i2.p1  ORF type:complete len:359 (+),score=37.59 TRINITY_DN13769_c0_g3_i2:63-1079(+)